jgi:hypothetical protein
MKKRGNDTNVEVRGTAEPNCDLQSLNDDELCAIVGGSWPGDTESHYGISFTCTSAITSRFYHVWICSKCNHKVAGDELDIHANGHVYGARFGTDYIWAVLD